MRGDITITFGINGLCHLGVMPKPGPGHFDAVTDPVNHNGFREISPAPASENTGETGPAHPLPDPHTP